MPGSAKDRKSLKNLTQQRQEQQRARPTSTVKTSAKGPIQQQDERRPILQSFMGFRPVTEFSSTVPSTASIPFPAPVATHPAPALSPAAPTLPEACARLDAEHAPLPRQEEALTPQLDALYRASRALADHIAEFDTITDGAYLNDLESALDGIATPETEAPFTPAQTTALDLTRQLASDLAIHAHHSHLDELIRRIPDLGTACGRAVANALREAR
ncbi:hypothetical protein [Deinococcus kurensis]|uniref:hypothetical protein n=1 Tax=Deinococcus kurensis TaxID=2662757 RepID=UPI0012D36C8C|nr:hypothetical protein [Deinococcus kurensis]